MYKLIINNRTNISTSKEVKKNLVFRKENKAKLLYKLSPKKSEKKNKQKTTLQQRVIYLLRL